MALEIIRTCSRCKAMFRKSKLRRFRKGLLCSVCYQIEMVRKFKRSG